MLGYVTIGALDSEKSVKFYDAVFGAIGYERKFLDKGWAGYGPKGSETPGRLRLSAGGWSAGPRGQRHHDCLQGEYKSASRGGARSSAQVRRHR